MTVTTASWKSFRSILILVILVASSVLADLEIATATNGARFTSLSAEYVELENDEPDDIYTMDRDGHEDDLIVTFTETGAGNSKNMDITVTATREVSMTCVSAFDSNILVQTEEPVSLRFPDEEPPGASATFVTDDNGRLTGTVPIHTSLAGYFTPWSDEEGSRWEPGHICPNPRDGVGIYVLKDYSLTYTDLTVTDNENGGATASLERVEPGYNAPTSMTFGIYTPVFSFICTTDIQSGNCHSD